MTKKTYKKSTITYYVHQNSTAKDALTNGSFVRWSKRYGYSRFMLGDFQGFLNELPKDMVMVSRECAEEYLPKCCK